MCVYIYTHTHTHTPILSSPHERPATRECMRVKERQKERLLRGSKPIMLFMPRMMRGPLSPDLRVLDARARALFTGSGARCVKIKPLFMLQYYRLFRVSLSDPVIEVETRFREGAIQVSRTLAADIAYTHGGLWCCSCCCCRYGDGYRCVSQAGAPAMIDLNGHGVSRTLFFRAAFSVWAEGARGPDETREGHHAAA